MYEDKKIALIITILTAVLVVFGIFMVYSASSVWAEAKFGDAFYYMRRQALFALVGAIGFFVTSRISTSFLKKHAKHILIISFILLGLVLIPGVGIERNGSQSWFGIGSFAVQPSELFKIAIVVFAAKFIADNFNKTHKIKGFIPLLAIMILGFVLIMLQPDFGTGIVIMASIIVMMFVSKLPTKYFVFMGMSGVLMMVGLIIAAPYRFQRITAFIDPWSDPLGSGFQIIQSLYAIGPGALLGSGALNSYQKHFYLPEPQTDFIYAIIVEEFGLIGGLIILLAFATLFIFGFKLARRQNDPFNCFLIVGLLGLIMIQVVINLGVVVALFPVTGVTLPLISYGGSSLSVCMCSLGLIVGRVRSKEKKNENTAISVG